LYRQFAVHVFEGASIALPVVARDPDSEEHDGCAAGATGFDDHGQVFFHSDRWKTAQAIVATELQDNEIRRKFFQCRGDPADAAFGRFTADAGVDDSMFVPLCHQAGLQQSGPRLVNIHTVARAEAVAEHHNRRRACVAGRSHAKKQ
jgi:hypothetical protein